MPAHQTQTKIDTKIGTKIAGVVLIVAGLGMLGLAAGVMPRIGQTEKLPELSGLIKNDGSSVTNVGDTLPYVIQVKNSGNGPAKDVKVANRIALGTLSYVSATGSNGFVCSMVSSNVTCTGGTIGLGKTATIKVETKLAVNSLACNSTGTIISTLSIDPDNTILESDELNNTGSTSNSMLGPCTEQNTDLQITKAGSPASVTDKQALSYAITVKNAGSVAATNVVVTDKVSSSLWTYRVATGSHGFTCSVSGTTVTCTGGIIPSGETASISLTGAIDLTGLECDQTSTLTNTAKVDPENAIPESNESNNSATVTTQLTSPCAGTTVTTTGGGSGTVSGGSSVSGDTNTSPINR
jgi:uncharacterized repeat protein (TIGR01451 family)